jgi:hypothetical protein
LSFCYHVILEGLMGFLRGRFSLFVLSFEQQFSFLSAWSTQWPSGTG